MNQATQALVDKVTSGTTTILQRIADAGAALRGQSIDGAAVAAAIDTQQAQINAAIDALKNGESLIG